jgi:hypothetical protein
MYEVKQLTGDTWVNNWKVFDDLEGETIQVFDTVEEAQEEIDEFFNDIHTEILNGNLSEDSSYNPNEFMICKVDDLQLMVA